MTSTPAAVLHGRVDPERGFLPAPDPLTRLPDAFSVWDEVGHDLPKLLAAGRACTALEAFRSTHLEYTARYIQKQAQVGVNPTDYGTGGTPFMRYLKKHRDETHRHRLSASRNANGVATST